MWEQEIEKRKAYAKDNAIARKKHELQSIMKNDGRRKTAVERYPSMKTGKFPDDYVFSLIPFRPNWSNDAIPILLLYSLYNRLLMHRLKFSNVIWFLGFVTFIKTMKRREKKLGRN